LIYLDHKLEKIIF